MHLTGYFTDPFKCDRLVMSTPSEALWRTYMHSSIPRSYLFGYIYDNLTASSSTSVIFRVQKWTIIYLTPPHSTPSPSAQHHIFDYSPCWWTSISNHVINTWIRLWLWFQCSFVKMTYYNVTYNHRLFKKHIQCRMLKHGHCPLNMGHL